MKVDDLPAEDSDRKATHDFFRSLSPPQTHLQKKFFQRPLSLSTSDQTWTIEWSPVTPTDHQASYPYAIALMDSANRTQLLMTLPQFPEAQRIDAARQSTDQNLIQAECCQILSPLLEALQKQAQTRLKAKIYFQPHTWSESDALSLRCHIKMTDGTVYCTGVIHFLDPDFFLDSFFTTAQSKKKNENDWLSLPCPVRIECGSQVLSYQELKELEFGDAILLAEVKPTQKKTYLTLMGYPFRWIGELKNNGFHIQGKEENMATSGGGSSSILSGELMQDSPPLEDVENIPVTLSFSLGSYEKNFSDITQLRPGYVLPLPGEFDQRQVEIMANGRKIGSGELIVVGDRLAVQIEQWQAKHDS